MRRRQTSSRCESDPPSFNGISNDGHKDDDNHEEHQGHEEIQNTKEFFYSVFWNSRFVFFVAFVVIIVFVLFVAAGARMTSRRIFLKSGAMAMLSLGFAPSFLARAAAGAPARAAKLLIAIFQRGAVDGLNVVVPYGEAEYYRARPTIAIPRPAAARRAGDRSRRLLRSASATGAAQAAVGQPLARHRPRVRIARRHAVALRRAGLHGERRRPA